MENNCQFVNSRGLLKSCNVHSKTPCSSWSYDTDYLKEMIKSNNMFDNMSIYVCTDALPFFLYEIMPKITHKFYLVSGDSDATVPNGNIDIWHNNPKKIEEDLCYIILSDSKLIKWFAQNNIFTCNDKKLNEQMILNSLDNNKIFQLPIGLDYHTISNDPSKFWRDTNEGSTPIEQETILKNIRKTMVPFHERIKKIYVQMTLTEDRLQTLAQIPSELLEINQKGMPRTQVWNQIKNYTFAFSPYGNGPDCHRHWEILLLGCIPIIKSFGTNEMFDDLPVLIVNEWSDITEKLLIETIEKFKVTTFNYDKLLLKYWVNVFSTPS